MYQHCVWISMPFSNYCSNSWVITMANFHFSHTHPINELCASGSAPSRRRTPWRMMCSGLDAVDRSRTLTPQPQLLPTCAWRLLSAKTISRAVCSQRSTAPTEASETVRVQSSVSSSNVHLQTSVICQSLEYPSLASVGASRPAI